VDYLLLAGFRPLNKILSRFLL
jgi:hypothetical protein